MRAKRGVIIVAVLAIAMVGLWLWVLGILPLKKTVREPAERPAAVQVSAEELKKKAGETAASLSKWLEEQERIDKMLTYHQGRRDPFLLPVKNTVEKSLPGQPPKLVLKGIAWDETNPLALINELLVKEDDSVEGARVVKIDFDRVALRYGSKKFVIKLIEWETES